MKRKSVVWCLCMWLILGIVCPLSQTASSQKTPVIVVTDLYHPFQDIGDNFDLITAYALPEIELKAVILDVTEAFRQSVARKIGPGLYPDAAGPRDPGFIPVWQLNYLFGRQVPCATGPFLPMKTPGDKMLDRPAFQQQGIELILKTLAASPEPVQILSFGSARTLAAAYNRQPELMRKKVKTLHLSAGSSGPEFLEWNVALDPQAIVCLLRSDLSIAIYPCAAATANAKGYGSLNHAFSYDAHNTFYKLPESLFIRQMNPGLRRYLDFAYGRLARPDFLHALDSDLPADLNQESYNSEHYIWETAAWMIVSGRHLVKRSDGSYRILPREAISSSDQILPTQLHHCRVHVPEDGRFTFEETAGPSNLRIYFRGDPYENEKALRQALPALYLSYAP